MEDLLFIYDNSQSTIDLSNNYISKPLKYRLVKLHPIKFTFSNNWERIKKIIHLAIAGKISDRLTRFGYELIEELITKYSKGKIIVLSENDKLEPEEELVKDVMAIMNLYVAKMNGLRKYKNLE